MKNRPNMMKKATVTTALPTLMRRSLNRCRGSMGWVDRASQAMKPMSPTAARAKAISTPPLVQPISGPSMIP